MMSHSQIIGMHIL